MLTARIYCPPKTAMQSGKAKTKQWVLTYNTPDSLFRDPLMGWTGTTATDHQIIIHFETLDDAITYAKKLNLEVTVEPQQSRKIMPKSYSDNFRYDKPRD